MYLKMFIDNEAAVATPYSPQIANQLMASPRSEAARLHTISDIRMTSAQNNNSFLGVRDDLD